MHCVRRRREHRMAHPIMFSEDDALLAIVGDQYVRLTGNSHRVPMLQSRLETLREVT